MYLRSKLSTKEIIIVWQISRANTNIYATVQLPLSPSQITSILTYVKSAETEKIYRCIKYTGEIQSVEQVKIAAAKFVSKN